MAEADCPFCRIVAQADPNALEVYRDDHVVAFLPLNPATIGHILVVPRDHRADIWSLDTATARHLTDAVLRLATILRDSLKPEGLNIIQSNGAAASQTVDHVHVHLVPRWTGDAMGAIWPVGGPQRSPDEQRSAWIKINNAVHASGD